MSQGIRSTGITNDTGSEKFLHVLDSVILRRSRRIWLLKKRFLSPATQILRFAQDDKRSARINPNLYKPTGYAARWVLVMGLVTTGVCGAGATGVSGVTGLVSQVSTKSYQDYLRNDLYAHDGDDRSCRGAQHDPAMRAIEERFESFALTTSLGPPFPCCSRLNYNVVGVHPGVVCPEEIYLVGAHYDTVADSPGAWDNASGVAGVLEAARILSQYSFEATIVFIAFDREEEGRKGSAAYATEHSLDHIRGMIALDGIAYRPYAAEDPNYEKVGLYYQIRRTALVDDLAAALRSYAGLTCVVTEDDLTDDAPFARLDFAAAALISRGLTAEVRPFMHTPQDSVDIPGYLDYNYGAQITRGVVGYLAAHARLTSVMRLPDFNVDGRINLKDFALLARNWRRKTSQFDISPSPQGDSVVGPQDLAGLSHYWLNRWTQWWPPFEFFTESRLEQDAVVEDAPAGHEGAAPEGDPRGSGLPPGRAPDRGSTPRAR
jgi:hypothetical protein